jgi:uncharacterized coiled-coil protein SlyX
MMSETDDEAMRVWREMADLAARVVALEHRVSHQETFIKGLAGKLEQLTQR